MCFKRVVLSTLITCDFCLKYNQKLKLKWQDLISHISLFWGGKGGKGVGVGVFTLSFTLFKNGMAREYDKSGAMSILMSY